MNFNPIDIVIILFLLLNMFFGYKNGLLNELKKNISIIVSIILTCLIINNLSNQFYFLKNQVDIFFLSSFLLIFILLVLFIGFFLDIIIEQIDDLSIDKHLNLAIGSTLGIIKGIVLISLLIFIFDTTPIEEHNKQKIYSKIQEESLFFEQCLNIKSLLFKK